MDPTNIAVRPSGEPKSGKKRGNPKGRPVDAQALADVQTLLGSAPRRRDLLIEHLHKIQDRYGHISAAHVVALAREMALAPAEVYEVATFYHHFDVIKEGDAIPPALTVRVCDSLSCELAGALPLLEKLKATLGPNVRVIPAPCIGRCEQAPAVVVGQNPVAQATVEAVSTQVAANSIACAVGKYIDFDEYRQKEGYKLAVECLGGKRDAEDILKIMEASSLRGLGGAGFPTGRKWRILRAERLPRLLAVNLDEGEPGTFKD
ncbi:MAG: NAD(P)H-dependent oxidoreductase subunit E, partial [Burkholderiales bacterium]